MWLLQLMGFSFVIGTIIGLFWRLVESLLERRAARREEETIVVMMGGEVQDSGVTPVTPTPPVQPAADTKSN